MNEAMNPAVNKAKDDSMIWLVGSEGMLGHDVAAVLDEQGWAYCASDKEVDFTDISALRTFTADKQITWIVNCAAYTAVDKAEDEPELAEQLNVAGPRNLGRLAEEIGAQVIHFSTDYVFGSRQADKRADRPIRENDEPSPESVYGTTKLKGEQALQAVCSRCCIIRIAWLYGLHGKNFVTTMIRLFNERGKVSVVDDQIGCPTWTLDAAELVRRIIVSDNGSCGVFHFCGGGQVSWYGFAREIARLAGKKGLLKNQPVIEPCSSDAFPSKAKRPPWSVLSTEKTASAFHLSIQQWQASLAKYLDQVRENEKKR